MRVDAVRGQDGGDVEIGGFCQLGIERREVGFERLAQQVVDTVGDESDRLQVVDTKVAENDTLLIDTEVVGCRST